MKTVLALLALILLAGGAVAGDLDTLAAWLTGSFSSAAQAEADSNYFDIRLEMARIWSDRDDGVWIYVEQAVGTHLDRPYRQRVYRVTQVEDDLFKSAVYSLPDPEAAIGVWREAAPLSGISPDDLTLRAGCAVFLRKDELGAFAGGTVGRGCGSTLHGAVYAESEVFVTPERIESWDRGFDAEDEHIWGAELGPYVFLKAAH